MYVVEHILEDSQKLCSIQQFCEFCEDIHKINKRKNDNYDIKKYNDLLKEVVFNCEQDYNYRINFFVKMSVEYPKVFGSLFKLKNKGKEKVKKFVENNNSFPTQDNKNLLNILVEKKKKLKERLTNIYDPISDNFQEKLTNSSNFDEKVDTCANNLYEFFVHS